MAKINKFKKWLHEQNSIALAKKVGVQDTTVYHWKGEYCSIAPKTMQVLVKMCEGAFTLEDLFDHVYPVGKPNKQRK